MTSALVVYASTHGHTAKIARRMVERLREDGLHVRLHDVATVGEADLEAYDLVVAGGSVHAGHHQRELIDWAARHPTTLNGKPSAFFSVCLAVADGSEASRAAASDYLDDFEERTGWTPTRRTTFAGALQYREYDFMTRLAMRLMMAYGHHPTDIGHDYVYTDWAAVEAFADACAGLVTRARA